MSIEALGHHPVSLPPAPAPADVGGPAEAESSPAAPAAPEAPASPSIAAWRGQSDFEAAPSENGLERPDFRNLSSPQRQAVVSTLYPTNEAVEALERRAIDPAQRAPLTAEERQHVDALRNGTFPSIARFEGGDARVSAYRKDSTTLVERGVGPVTGKGTFEVKQERGLSAARGAFASVSTSTKLDATVRGPSIDVGAGHKREEKTTVDASGVTSAAATAIELRLKRGPLQAGLGLDDSGRPSVRVGVESPRPAVTLRDGRTVERAVGLEAAVQAPRPVFDSRRETAARIIRALNARGLGTSSR
jgi:hypothetical protein